MSYALEHPRPQDRFDASDQKRLQLIEQMDRVHESESRGIAFGVRSRLMARQAVKLAKRPEVYPMQAFDLATRLAALNPKLEKKAHKIIEKKFAEKSDMPKPLEDLTYKVLEKTVEISADHEDDTATLPRLVIAADSELTEELISHLPEGKALAGIANAQEAEYNALHNQPVVSNVVELQKNKVVVSPTLEATAASHPVQTPEDNTSLLKAS